MAFTFPAEVAWDPNGKQQVKNASFQVFATTDTTFSTPLTITDPFGNPIPGNILNSGNQGVFPQFMHATQSAVVIADATRTYAWTIPCVLQDAAIAAFAANPASALATQLNTTYAPVSGSANYTSPTQAAGISVAMSVVFGG